MCTGDNILTAISVSRECNLIDKNAHCLYRILQKAGQNVGCIIDCC